MKEETFLCLLFHKFCPSISSPNEKLKKDQGTPNCLHEEAGITRGRNVPWSLQYLEYFPRSLWSWLGHFLVETGEGVCALGKAEGDEEEETNIKGVCLLQGPCVVSYKENKSSYVSLVE